MHLNGRTWLAGCLVATTLFAAGCSNNATGGSSGGTASGPTRDTSVDALYLIGTPRESIEAKYGASKLYWVRESVPGDDFAAATMREMVSLGKPRPHSYQVFLTRRLDVPTGYFRDYVFYNDVNRVIYVARRTA